jgi:ABC-type multidrug transport system ATPase subunit
MWAALAAASPGLMEQFKSANVLNTYISEGGNNSSLGHRQLICLARALIKKSRILAPDEATSSVDAKTDQEMQETIRCEFVDKGVTVITVAHRLDTVLGYDKIAVLGAGRILEYGSPAELLRIQRGELRRLVEADSLIKRKGSKNGTETLVSEWTRPRVYIIRLLFWRTTFSFRQLWRSSSFHAFEPPCVMSACYQTFRGVHRDATRTRKCRKY